ncbi:cold shock domain-containing protein [Vibrio coralliirubri]|uniref:cold shock domain-containing protein n=1 Tax=Vibrio coralliirubri TaxID=1516159 RepID=UPI0022847330|nr:cold shock domain-containing protein [Vibrio coralliirubri]MCY9861252.1 cold shock domain-containing protein [Vibrio coralliirubri]
MSTHNGTIKCFLSNKNFGFITDSSTGNDIFFHPRNLVGALKGMLNSRELVGTPVTYTVAQQSKGAAAMNISFDIKAAELIDEANVNISKKKDSAGEAVNASVESPTVEINTNTKANELKEKIVAVGSTVGSRMLSVAKIDDPKAVEIAKVRVTNFALIAVYNSKIGLSRILDRVVYALDRSGDYISKSVITLAETKKPNLKQLENK